MSANSISREHTEGGAEEKASVYTYCGKQDYSLKLGYSHSKWQLTAKICAPKACGLCSCYSACVLCSAVSPFSSTTSTCYMRGYLSSISDSAATLLRFLCFPELTRACASVLVFIRLCCPPGSHQALLMLFACLWRPRAALFLTCLRPETHARPTGLRGAHGLAAPAALSRRWSETHRRSNAETAAAAAEVQQHARQQVQRGRALRGSISAKVYPTKP